VLLNSPNPVFDPFSLSLPLRASAHLLVVPLAQERNDPRSRSPPKVVRLVPDALSYDHSRDLLFPSTGSSLLRLLPHLVCSTRTLPRRLLPLTILLLFDGTSFQQPFLPTTRSSSPFHYDLPFASSCPSPDRCPVVVPTDRGHPPDVHRRHSDILSALTRCQAFALVSRHSFSFGRQLPFFFFLAYTRLWVRYFANALVLAPLLASPKPALATLAHNCEESPPHTPLLPHPMNGSTSPTSARLPRPPPTTRPLPLTLLPSSSSKSSSRSTRPTL
jgi:hypothetical protein